MSRRRGYKMNRIPYAWIPAHIEPPIRRQIYFIRYWGDDGDEDFLEYDGGWFDLEGRRILRNVKSWFLLLK